MNSMYINPLNDGNWLMDYTPPRRWKC